MDHQQHAARIVEDIEMVKSQIVDGQNVLTDNARVDLTDQRGENDFDPAVPDDRSNFQMHKSVSENAGQDLPEGYFQQVNDDGAMS